MVEVSESEVGIASFYPLVCHWKRFGVKCLDIFLCNVHATNNEHSKHSIYVGCDA